MYLKKTKYNSLMETMESGYTPYFAVIFKDYIYLWDVSTLDLEFHNEYLENNCVIEI